MEYLKYSEKTLEAFNRLGFVPRENQLEAVCRVLFEFVDNKIQNCVMSAPTGTGKSIIGAVVAEALSAIRNSNTDAPKASISLVSTNVLSEQYGDTFKNLGNTGKYLMLKGAGNYSCSALSSIDEQVNADSCAWFTMVQSGSEFNHIINEHCNKCDFFNAKKRKNLSRHLTTNYSYFFVDRMYTGKFEQRDLIVWDEAHLVNDLFSEHNAIYFSEKRMNQMLKDISETVTITDIEITKKIRAIAKDCTIKGKINENNYRAYLSALMDIYQYASKTGAALAESSLRSNKMQSYTKYSRFTKKYEGLNCKIDDLFKYEYEHVFDYNEEDQAVSVKPIFVGAMMDALQCSDHNLFMSATLSDNFLTKTLHLDKTKTVFIKLPSTFPRENKEIVFYDPLSLSYVSMQNQETVKKLCKNAANCVKKHIEDGDRGIVLTPSFKLQNDIVRELNSQPWKSKYKLFEHRQGEKLADVLSAFKAYKDGPAVLISPSMYEGIDLSGDLSRFQVMVKAPFPSLGDKRMKFILDNHKDLYELLTIQKLVQGAGRSVRSKDDFATTYILDLNAQRLMTSKANIWSDEFNFRFTKFI